jgi:hypothetical protein
MVTSIVGMACNAIWGITAPTHEAGDEGDAADAGDEGDATEEGDAANPGEDAATDASVPTDVRVSDVTLVETAPPPDADKADTSSDDDAPEWADCSTAEGTTSPPPLGLAYPPPLDAGQKLNDLAAKGPEAFYYIAKATACISTLSIYGTGGDDAGLAVGIYSSASLPVGGPNILLRQVVFSSFPDGGGVLSKTFSPLLIRQNDGFWIAVLEQAHDFEFLNANGEGGASLLASGCGLGPSCTALPSPWIVGPQTNDGPATLWAY